MGFCCLQLQRAAFDTSNVLIQQQEHGKLPQNSESGISSKISKQPRNQPHSLAPPHSLHPWSSFPQPQTSPLLPKAPSAHFPLPVARVALAVMLL